MMNFDEMIKRATETMLDLDEIEMQFFDSKTEFSPELRAAENQYRRLYKLLEANLDDEEQHRLLRALDDSIGDQLCARDTALLVTGLIFGFRYAGFSDERIKATLAAVLPDLERASTAGEQNKSE